MWSNWLDLITGSGRRCIDRGRTRLRDAGDRRRERTTMRLLASVLVAAE